MFKILYIKRISEPEGILKIKLYFINICKNIHFLHLLYPKRTFFIVNQNNNICGKYWKRKENVKNVTIKLFVVI